MLYSILKSKYIFFSSIHASCNHFSNSGSVSPEPIQEVIGARQGTTQNKEPTPKTQSKTMLMLTGVIKVFMHVHASVPCKGSAPRPKCLAAIASRIGSRTPQP